jgi:hypothetical protein
LEFIAPDNSDRISSLHRRLKRFVPGVVKGLVRTLGRCTQLLWVDVRDVGEEIRVQTYVFAILLRSLQITSAGTGVCTVAGRMRSAARKIRGKYIQRVS